MARYPPKKGRCEIRGCKNTPTEWHHVISQAQIKKRGLPAKYYTDPGNLKEFCRTHHDMTTASMNRKFLEKKTSRKSRKKTKRKVNSRSKKKYQCSGFSTKRKRCTVRASTVPEDGFCKFHLFQAPQRHPQYQGDPNAYRPGINDEGTLNEKQKKILRGHIYSSDGRITDRMLLSFGYKSHQWRKRWLVEEPKKVPKPSGRIVTR